MDAARRLYAGRVFVHVTGRPPQAKRATGLILAFVSCVPDPECDSVATTGVVDCLSKGAAGRAVLGANLISGLSATERLDAYLCGQE